MSEFRDTDDKVKDDVEDTGDKIKSGFTLLTISNNSPELSLLKDDDNPKKLPSLPSSLQTT